MLLQVGKNTLPKNIRHNYKTKNSEGVHTSDVGKNVPSWDRKRADNLGMWMQEHLNTGL